MPVSRGYNDVKGALFPRKLVSRSYHDVKQGNFVLCISEGMDGTGEGEGYKCRKCHGHPKDFDEDGLVDTSGSNTDSNTTAPALKSRKELCLSLKKRKADAPIGRVMRIISAL